MQRCDRETRYPPTYITKQQGGTEAYIYMVQVIYLELNVYKDHLRDDQSYHPQVSYDILLAHGRHVPCNM
jgi:hypothetical protein